MLLRPGAAALDEGNAMDTGHCPGCGAATVFDGRMTPRGDSTGIGFEPHGTISSIWKPGLDVPAQFRWCSSCGLIWTRLAPDTLRTYVRDRGGSLAWEHLQAVELGPAHDLPDCPEARRAAEGVAEIDSLVLSGRQPEATRRYREILRVTWDRAINDVRNWRERPRAERLGLFGWRPKGGATDGDPKATGHPMHDPVLDGP